MAAAKVILNEEQKETFKALQRFIEHPVANTFILKGFAGTGKTFLMQHFAKWLQQKSHKFSLLASTGRAAAVLRGKTGMATRTLHSELYHFNSADGADDDGLPEDAPIDESGQLAFSFSLRSQDKEPHVYIIDESSMLSNSANSDPGLVFGSGELISDLFQAAGINKIIFVGDPGQLPPVKELVSPALEMEWHAAQQRVAVTSMLERIMRVDADNDLLVLAAMIRNMAMNNNEDKYPKLPARNLNNVKLYESDEALFQNFLARFRKSGSNQTIAIARSNRMVNQINQAARRDLFGELNMPLQNNDILLVTHNNYKFPLANGDFAQVVEIFNVESKAGLAFQRVRVRALLTNAEFELLLSLDILYGNDPDFSKRQLKTLMVDFHRRMAKRKIEHTGESYHDAMRRDPYVNCLRAKYGYAVTCHKAQGGEWNDVYLFLEKSMYAMHREELFRWWYTAVTRASSSLHLTDTWWIR